MSMFHGISSIYVLALLSLSQPIASGQTAVALDRVPVPVSASELIGVSLLDGSTGIIFTHFRAWMATDGGKRWHELEVAPANGRLGMPNMIASAAFFSKDLAWIGAVGAVMTGDGGRSWFKLAPPGPAPAISDVFCLASGAPCWAVGSEILGPERRPPISAIFMSIDRGKEWRRQTLPSRPEDSGLYAVHFFDGLRGVTLGDSVAYHTGDGGTNWSVASFDATCNSSKAAAGFRSLVGSAFRAPSTVWLSLGGGGILCSTDGGANFCRIGTSPETGFRQIFFVSQTSGWAVDRWGKLYSTVDSGKSWKVVSVPFAIRCLSVGDDQSAWALSSKELRRIKLVP
jgi:photosystem II stability/assembly factor-like uncharacterized protein